MFYVCPAGSHYLKDSFCQYHLLLLDPVFHLPRAIIWSCWLCPRSASEPLVPFKFQICGHWLRVDRALPVDLAFMKSWLFRDCGLLLQLPSAHLSIHASIHTHIYLFFLSLFHPSINQCIHTSVFLSCFPSSPSFLLSFPPSIHPSIHASIHMSVLPSFLPFINPSIHLPYLPSIHLFIPPSVHHPSIHAFGTIDPSLRVV